MPHTLSDCGHGQVPLWSFICKMADLAAALVTGRLGRVGMRKLAQELHPARAQGSVPITTSSCSALFSHEGLAAPWPCIQHTFTVEQTWVLMCLRTFARLFLKYLSSPSHRETRSTRSSLSSEACAAQGTMVHTPLLKVWFTTSRGALS